MLWISGSQPLFWESHAAPKHHLRGPRQYFYKTSNQYFV